MEFEKGKKTFFKYYDYDYDYISFNLIPIKYISNRPHFLRVYRRDKPRGMLGEHEKSV